MTKINLFELPFDSPTNERLNLVVYSAGFYQSPYEGNETNRS
jgi:hypothetical protein